MIAFVFVYDNQLVTYTFLSLSLHVFRSIEQEQQLKMTRRRLLLVLLLMMAIRDTVDGSSETNSNHRLHRSKINKRRNVVLFEGEDHNAMCRLPDGSYLPVDLVGLMHRCYLSPVFCLNRFQ